MPLEFCVEKAAHGMKKRFVLLFLAMACAVSALGCSKGNPNLSGRFFRFTPEEFRQAFNEELPDGEDQIVSFAEKRLDSDSGYPNGIGYEAFDISTVPGRIKKGVTPYILGLLADESGRVGQVRILLYHRLEEDRTGPILSAVMAVCDPSLSQSRRQEMLGEFFASVGTDREAVVFHNGLVYRYIQLGTGENNGFLVFSVSVEDAL